MASGKIPDYLECILIKSGSSGIKKAVSEMEKNLNKWEMEIWEENPWTGKRGVGRGPGAWDGNK